VLAAGLGQFDPAERYGIDIFHDRLPEGEARTIPISFVSFAQEIHRLDNDAVLATRQELYACVPDDPSAPRVATEYAELLKRHAASTLKVLADVGAEMIQPLVSLDVDTDSLLWLALHQPTQAPPVERTTEPVADAFRREGDFWMITFNGKSVTMRNLKGIRHIVMLVRHQGQEISTSDLAAADRDLGPSELTEAQAEESDLHIVGSGGEDEIADEQSMNEWKAKLQQLLAERKAAEDAEQIEEADRLAPIPVTLAIEDPDGAGCQCWRPARR